MTLADGVDSLFERSGLQGCRVEEHGAAAMGAEFHQRRRLAHRRNVPGRALAGTQIDGRQADCPWVAQNQLLQSGLVIAYHLRETLFGDREDAALGRARVSVIEDAELEAGDVFLDDGV